MSIAKAVKTIHNRYMAHRIHFVGKFLRHIIVSFVREANDTSYINYENIDIETSWKWYFRLVDTIFRCNIYTIAISLESIRTANTQTYTSSIIQKMLPTFEMETYSYSLPTGVVLFNSCIGYNTLVSRCFAAIVHIFHSSSAIDANQFSIIVSQISNYCTKIPNKWWLFSRIRCAQLEYAQLEL